MNESPQRVGSDDVHRVVMPYRAWDLMGIIGRDQAHTLLRQSVRYCVRAEQPNQVRYHAPVRAALPRILDQHRLKHLILRAGTVVSQNRLARRFGKSLP